MRLASAREGPGSADQARAGELLSVGYLESSSAESLDGEHPIRPCTVARRMGHASLTMVLNVYSHLGTVRHRDEHVEYRVEQHKKRLGARLRLIAA